MSIATVDDIASALASAQDINICKVFTALKAAGSFQSGWLASGIPGAGSAPPVFTAGSGYTCDRTTSGAMAYTNASTQNYLARAGAMCSAQTGTLIIYDRLWSCSGMGFAASTYTVTTPGSLPARITDNGKGCEIWAEQFAAAGAASGTLTVNYLDDLTGAAKAGVIPAVVSAPVTGQMQQVPHQAGTSGVRGIVSAVNSATWTSGTFGISILKRVIEIPIPSIAAGTNLDWALCALTKIPNDACLMLAFLGSATTAPTILGALDLIDK